MTANLFSEAEIIDAVNKVYEELLPQLSGDLEKDEMFIGRIGRKYSYPDQRPEELTLEEKKNGVVYGLACDKLLHHIIAEDVLKKTGNQIEMEELDMLCEDTVAKIYPKLLAEEEK